MLVALFFRFLVRNLLLTTPNGIGQLALRGGSPLVLVELNIGTEALLCPIDTEIVDILPEVVVPSPICRPGCGANGQFTHRCDEQSNPLPLAPSAHKQS